MSTNTLFKVLGTKITFESRAIEIKSSRYSERITYTRVAVERLDVTALKITLQETHTQDINVFQIGNFLGYEYKKNNPVFISKSDGLLYAQDDSYNSCREAIILLQKLNKFGLVVDFERTQWHSRPNITKGWID